MEKQAHIHKWETDTTHPYRRNKRTIKHTQSLLIISPLSCTRGLILFWGRQEEGKHSRRVSDDPLIPPWTIGSPSVGSYGGLLMCQSWLLVTGQPWHIICIINVRNEYGYYKHGLSEAMIAPKTMSLKNNLNVSSCQQHKDTFQLIWYSHI